MPGKRALGPPSTVSQWPSLIPCSHHPFHSQNDLQIPRELEKMMPTRHANLLGGAAQGHPGQPHLGTRIAGNFCIHQLCGSRESLYCCSFIERRAWHFRVATGRSALRLFLDLRVSATLLRLASRPFERQLGLCRRVLSLVRRDSRDGHRTYLLGAVAVATGPRHGRISRLSFLLKDPCAALSRRASRACQCGDRCGTRVGTWIWHAARRPAYGKVRVAPVFHCARPCQPAVARPLAQVDARETRRDSHGHDGRTEPSGVSALAIGLGNLRRPILF